MKSFTITKNDAGQRLDRFIAKTVPLLPASLSQKYIRLKRIKVNGQRAQRDTRLTAGDQNKKNKYLNFPPLGDKFRPLSSAESRLG